VEDNPANLRLVEQIFALLPELQLVSAELPSRGLELARAEPPDLVLLDINMPEMDGYELLARLRAEPRLREVPTVAISANAMPGAIERGLESGFDAYLTKPLNVEHFLETLKSLLQGQSGHRQN
jgi:CheY-like chemotaxis protein